MRPPAILTAALAALGIGRRRDRDPALGNELFLMAPGASLASDARLEEMLAGYVEQPTDEPRPYLMLSGGIAAIPFCGCLSKYVSVWRALGLSDKPTLPELTAAVLAAGAAEDVRGLLAVFDSPGGTASGTPEAAAAVASVARVKPVFGYASDNCASGALWIAAQCGRLTTNSIGHVGSIGVYSVLLDSSEAAAAEGLRFVLVSTGGVKGQGEDGVPLSDEYIGEIQGRIDAIGEVFFAGLAEGLGLDPAAVKAMANGHVYVGQQAVDAGLVDGVESLGECLGALTRAAAGGALPSAVDLPTFGGADECDDEPGLAAAFAQVRAESDLGPFVGVLPRHQLAAARTALVAAASAGRTRNYAETLRLHSRVADLAASGLVNLRPLTDGDSR